MLVIGGRLLGGLQPIELAAYDQFMRWKPSEAKDQRLLLVEIDDVDIKTQNKSHPVGVRGGSLPDPTLAQLLDKLQSARPQVIGLDMYRDFATDQPRLAQHFNQTANFVVLCKLRAETVDGVHPPPELPENQFEQRLGFSDLAFDEDFAFNKGITVRRQVLVNEPTPPECQTDRSFSLAIAQQYLDAQGKSYRPPFDANGTFLQELQFGQTRFPRLNPFAAAYFSNDIGGGYQTMLNFRSYQRSSQNFIDRVKLRDVLADQVPMEKIRDRMVLIGVTSRASVNDYAMTPVGVMPGVMIQAQMISQLTSAAMDRRVLIWWWPFWGDVLWVIGWAGVGGRAAGCCLGTSRSRSADVTGRGPAVGAGPRRTWCGAAAFAGLRCPSSRRRSSALTRCLAGTGVAIGRGRGFGATSARAVPGFNGIGGRVPACFSCICRIRCSARRRRRSCVLIFVAPPDGVALGASVVFLFLSFPPPSTLPTCLAAQISAIMTTTAVSNSPRANVVKTGPVNGM